MEETQTSIGRLQEKNKSLEESIRHNEESISRLEEDNCVLRAKLQELQNLVDDNRKESLKVSSKLEQEKTELTLRLSKLAGANLTYNNPNIADLSDENRPTKLAEEFSELYDNEWTDAFEVIKFDDDSEKIRSMLDILMKANKLCQETTQNHINAIKQGFATLNVRDESQEKVIAEEQTTDVIIKTAQKRESSAENLENQSATTDQRQKPEADISETCAENIDDQATAKAAENQSVKPSNHDITTVATGSHEEIKTREKHSRTEQAVDKSLSVDMAESNNCPLEKETLVTVIYKRDIDKRQSCDHAVYVEGLSTGDGEKIQETPNISNIVNIQFQNSNEQHKTFDEREAEDNMTQLSTNIEHDEAIDDKMEKENGFQSQTMCVQSDTALNKSGTTDKLPGTSEQNEKDVTHLQSGLPSENITKLLAHQMHNEDVPTVDENTTRTEKIGQTNENGDMASAAIKGTKGVKTAVYRKLTADFEQLRNEQKKAILEIRTFFEKQLSTEFEKECTTIVARSTHEDLQSDDCVTKYIQKCIKVCWSMCRHEPPVYIGFHEFEGDLPFDTNIFKAYTKSGKHVDFVVWPPLYLHKGGPLLSKGVAQGR